MITRYHIFFLKISHTALSRPVEELKVCSPVKERVKEKKATFSTIIFIKCTDSFKIVERRSQQFYEYLGSGN
jgi:hypothetical protein